MTSSVIRVWIFGTSQELATYLESSGFPVFIDYPSLLAGSQSCSSHSTYLSGWLPDFLAAIEAHLR
jgi:hypothetical protein